MAGLAENLSLALARGDCESIDSTWEAMWAGAARDASLRIGAEAMLRGLPLDLLHELVVTPGHHVHQEVAFEIQQRADPTSLPVVTRILDTGFEYLAYTCSKDRTIAKWFGHILTRIGTPEAVAMVQVYARSDNSGIAEEMQYRLRRIGQQVAS